jgi:hypothetical protein
MAITAQGVARFKGSSGAITVGGFIGATFTSWTATVTPKEPKVTELAGKASTIITADGGEIELTGNVVFAETTTADIAAPGTICTTTSFTTISLLGEADALNKKWVITSASIAATTDDIHTGTITLKRWIGVTFA